MKDCFLKLLELSFWSAHEDEYCEIKLRWFWIAYRDSDSTTEKETRVILHFLAIMNVQNRGYSVKISFACP